MDFYARNWYWIIGNSSEVFSSQRMEFVPLTDTLYETWLAMGGYPARANTFNEILTKVLPPDIAASAAPLYTTAPVASLLDAQVSASFAARIYYDSLISAGFTFDGVLYAVDPISLAKATGAGNAAAASLIAGSGIIWPTNFSYVSMSGALKPMTANQMLTLSNALFHYVAACDAQLATISAAISAATSIGAVQAISVSSGYPSASG